MGQMIEFYETNKVDNINMDVIRFIDEVSNFPDRDGASGEQINHLFCTGYCYYFARMLEDAFGGKICWAQDRGYIVWADCDKDCTIEQLQDAVSYDITGVFDDYERLWPVEYLGNAIVDYMHNGKEFHISDDFKDWCNFCKVSEIYAIDVIWGCMSIDEIMSSYKDGMNYVNAAYLYYCTYPRECQQIIRHNSKNTNHYFFPEHLGVLETYAKICE